MRTSIGELPGSAFGRKMASVSLGSAFCCKSRKNGRRLRTTKQFPLFGGGVGDILPFFISGGLGWVRVGSGDSRLGDVTEKAEDPDRAFPRRVLPIFLGKRGRSPNLGVTWPGGSSGYLVGFPLTRYED